MLIYLDNAATSYPKPTILVEALQHSMLNHVSPNRGTYKISLNATEALFETRETVSKFFNIDDSSHFVFTPGCTFSLNYVLKGIDWNQNDTVIISNLEHNSLYRPLLSLQKKYNLNIIILPYLKGKGFNIEDFKKVFESYKVKLVALTHVSNLTGEILPIRKVLSIAKETNTKVLIDGSQAVGSFNVDLNELAPDFYAFGGHKHLLGPPGVGGLYVKNTDDLTPIIEGGTGSDSIDLAMPDYLPDKFEPGTLNLPAIWALNSAISFIQSENIDNIYKRKKELLTSILESFHMNHNITCYSNIQNNIGIIAFNINGWSASEVSLILDKKYNISVRAGMHCTPLAHKAIGTLSNGCIRASLGCFTTDEEVRIFIRAIKQISESIK